MTSSGLIIFVKNPISGAVKTRLAASIGNTYALEVYHKLLELTREATTKVNVNRFLYYGSEIADDNWSQDYYSKHVQQGKDLGARMAHAFKEVFASNNKAVIIGSDCPEISPDLIEMAFRRLDIADVVIGPSTDSGYYLLGMKKFYPELFQEIEWSTAQVMPQTVSAIKKLALLYNLLPELTDVDTVDDLKKFPELIPVQSGLTSS